MLQKKKMQKSVERQEIGQQFFFSVHSALAELIKKVVLATSEFSDLKISLIKMMTASLKPYMEKKNLS